MTDFNDRERAEEKKFQLNKELEFKAQSRCHKRLAQWLAAEVGDDEQSLTDQLLQAEVMKDGHKAVLALVLEIIKRHNRTDISERLLIKKIEELLQQARREVMAEQ